MTKTNKKPNKTAARNRTKAAQMISLLHRPAGASLAELMKVTGWQAHSVRGFLSGSARTSGLRTAKWTRFAAITWPAMEQHHDAQERHRGSIDRQYHRPRASRLAKISTLPRPDLVELWSKTFGQPPPKAASTALLRRAIAYRMQEAQQGGVKKRELKALLQFASPVQRIEAGDADLLAMSDAAASTAIGGDEGVKTGSLTVSSATAKRRNSSASMLPLALRPGTRLVSSWQGRTHVVEVVEEGLVWNGKTFRSLSAIALAITGARWSRKRFFRL